MDERNFDHLTATLASGTGRRRAISGLVAGTAAVFGLTASTAASKKKCKKPDLCPQRSACSCLDDTCKLIKGTNLATIISACEAFRGQNNFDGVNFPIPGLADFCASNGDRTLVDCPVPL